MEDAQSIETTEEAENRLIKNYYRLFTVDEMVNAINDESPVVISMCVYDNFYDIESGNQLSVKLPGDFDYLLGGHAVTLVGYDLDKQQFIVRNSFGPNWGIDGYFIMPFEYARQEIMDAWIFDIDLK